MTDFLMQYFLIGLALSFLGTVAGKKPQSAFLWIAELLALVLWPLAFLVGLVMAVIVAARKR